MATFALIHGGGDVGWYWHLVEAQLRLRGHDVVAPDLPGDNDDASLDDYADTVVEAIRGRGNLIVVGQSYGGFTAPLVADRVPVDVLVLVAGMIPAPGESPADWWTNTGYGEAVRVQARRDGGQTGSDDPFVAFYHDVPRALAEEALSRERGESDTAYNQPVAARGVARRADKVRAVHRGPLLSRRFHASGRRRTPRHCARRDRLRPLRGAQPPEGAG